MCSPRMRPRHQIRAQPLAVGVSKPAWVPCRYECWVGPDDAHSARTRSYLIEELRRSIATAARPVFKCKREWTGHILRLRTFLPVDDTPLCLSYIIQQNSGFRII